MRELKFRIWDHCSKSFIDEGRGIDPRNEDCNYGDEVTFQQFVGVKDKYGQDIYEGDLVKYQWKAHNGDFETEVGEVFFEEGIFYFGVTALFATNDSNFLTNTLEVVGNIIEHGGS